MVKHQIAATSKPLGLKQADKSFVNSMPESTEE